jgi:hypothetical protein
LGDGVILRIRFNRQQSALWELLEKNYTAQPNIRPSVDDILRLTDFLQAILIFEDHLTKDSEITRPPSQDQWLDT